MIRHLKAFGPILVATFAIGAIAASTAQAVEGQFSWAAVTKYLDLASEGEQKFTTTVGTTTCETGHGKGNVEGIGASTITLEQITFKDFGTEDKCHGPLSTTPTVKSNLCDFRFHVGKTLKQSPEGETEGTVDVLCPPEKSITIDVTFGCSIDIGPQMERGPVFYRTAKAGSKEYITVELKVTNLHYQHTGFTCGAGTSLEGAYSGNFVLQGIQADETTLSDATVT